MILLLARMRKFLRTLANTMARTFLSNLQEARKCQQIGMSALLGKYVTTPYKYLTEYRLSKATELLKILTSR